MISARSPTRIRSPCASRRSSCGGSFFAVQHGFRSCCRHRPDNTRLPAESLPRGGGKRRHPIQSRCPGSNASRCRGRPIMVTSLVRSKGAERRPKRTTRRCALFFGTGSATLGTSRIKGATVGTLVPGDDWTNAGGKFASVYPQRGSKGLRFRRRFPAVAQAAVGNERCFPGQAGGAAATSGNWFGFRFDEAGSGSGSSPASMSSKLVHGGGFTSQLVSGFHDQAGNRFVSNGFLWQNRFRLNDQ